MGRGTWNYENPTPYTLQACSSFSNAFSEFLGPVCVKYRIGRKIRNHKISSRMHVTFSRNSASGPFFLRHLVPHVCPCIWRLFLTLWKFRCIALEPEIPSKRWFAWAFCKLFFTCYAVFTSVWTYKTHDPTVTISSFLLVLACIGWIDKFQGDSPSSISLCTMPCLTIEFFFSSKKQLFSKLHLHSPNISSMLQVQAQGVYLSLGPRLLPLGI